MKHILAGCKLNLGLQVLARRQDGYHIIRSCFLPLSFPRDELCIIPTTDKDLIIQCSLPITGENILQKTYTVYAEYTGIKKGIKVILKKGIPMGGGLGGGSSDAACFLKWLNEYNKTSLKNSELFDLAKKIGADVPFFLINKPSLVCGIGDEITPIETFPEFWIVIVYPDININTGWVFKKYDQENEQEKSLTNLVVKDRDFFLGNTWGLNFKNDLEKVVLKKYPQLKNLKEKLYELNANFAAMSGSGSTVYGIFTNADDAKNSVKILNKSYRNIFFAKS